MKIIDGNNMLHRESERIGSGIHPVRQVYLKYHTPSQTTIVVWDGPFGSSQRRKLFPEYKKNRKPKEESKLKFFEIAKAVLRYTPLIQIECKDWEADDVIGTLINSLHNKHNLIVESNDGDYWQHSDKASLPLVTKRWRNMTPKESLLYKATVGETKDNLLGLRGFGEAAFEKLTDTDKSQIISAIEGKDFSKFQSIAQRKFPKKNKITLDLFEKLCLNYHLNHYWEVPEIEITKGTTVGSYNPKAAELLMEKFLI